MEVRKGTASGRSMLFDRRKLGREPWGLSRRERKGKMKNAMVTGANGFVGAAVCKELASSGVQVTGIVHNEKSDIGRIRDVPNLKIEYCDMAEIRKLPERLEPGYDIFYHFAWEGSAGALRGDEAAQLKNVQAACDAVKASNGLGCGRFVFASSIMSYEVDKRAKAEKGLEIGAIYGTAKMAADYMAHALACSLGITYMSGLISNIYGPGEKSRRLIHSSISQLLDGGETEFSDGSQLYDFIYITDAARFFKAIGEYGEGDKIYYIGSGAPRPLKEYLWEMGEAVAPGRNLGIGKLGQAAVSLDYKEFDINGVQDMAGITAEVSFSEGVRSTAAWLQRDRNLLKRG